jgi:hypothetical protein
MRSIFSSVRVKLTAVALAALVLAWPSIAPRLQAQATTVQTTLSAAVTATADRVVVASATGVSAGRILVIDREAFVVQSITGTTALVRRGTNGTFAAAHISGAVVLGGPTNYFLQSDPPPGGCTATNFIALPAVVLPSGSVFNCSASSLVRYRDSGLTSFTVGPAQAYATTGAITVMPGLATLGSGGAIAMTLAAPTAAQDGMVIDMVVITAQAHTVTATTIGFNAGGAATDLCTFTAAIGNQISVRAYNGNWYILSARNCTLS